MPRNRLALALVTLVTTLLAAAPALAVPPAFGGLTPLTAPLGCFNTAGADGCTAHPPQAGGSAVEIAGSVLYATAGSGAVLAYRRNADGSLTPFDCVRSAALAPACTTVDDQLSVPQALAASTATKTLYVANGIDAASSRVIAYRIDADGGIGAPLGCLSQQAALGCIDVQALDQPKDLELAADGRALYAASDGAGGGLAAFALNADGTFPAAATQLGGCVAPEGGPAPPCVTNTLTNAQGLAVRGNKLYAVWKGSSGNNSGVEWYGLAAATGAIGARQGCVGNNASDEPQCATEYDSLSSPLTVLAPADGRSVAVGSFAALTSLATDAGGAIGARLSCEANDVFAGCTRHPALQDTVGLALSPDGRTLYSASLGAGIWAFARDPATGATSGLVNCVAGTIMGCAAFAALGNASAVAVAPDGARVFGNSSTALAILQREVGPTCLPASATVTAGATSVALTLACSDLNGDPLTYELASPPAHGDATVTSAGAAAYTPAPGYAGTDTFGFRATDGSVASSATNVTIGVVGPAKSETPTPTPAPPIAARSTIDPIGSPVRAKDLKRFSGRAFGDGLKRVEIAVVRLDHGARSARAKPACRRLLASGRLGSARRSKSCAAARFLTASGTARWTFNLIRDLPRGRYVVVSRAVGGAGIEKRYSAAARNQRTFRVR